MHEDMLKLTYLRLLVFSYEHQRLCDAKFSSVFPCYIFAYVVLYFNLLKVKNIFMPSGKPIHAQMKIFEIYISN